MNSSRLINAILIFSISLFGSILIYLNTTIYKDKKENLVLEISNIASEEFFATAFNSLGLKRKIQRFHTDPNYTSEKIKKDLSEIFINYSKLSDNINYRVVLFRPNVKNSIFISVPRFEIRTPQTTLSIINSNDSIQNEYPLYGDPASSTNHKKHLFYKIDEHYFAQINFYFSIINLDELIRDEIYLTYLMSFLLLVIFLLAMYYVKNAYRKQQYTIRFQTDFLNMISHEFNTPLSTIKLAGQTIVKKYTEPELISISESILRQQAHLAHLTDQVFNLSFIEDYKNTHQTNEVQSEKFLHECVTSFNSRNNTSVKVDILEHTCIRIDESLFTIAIANLLENAIKHSNATEITVNGKQCNKHYHISIFDNGIGIPQEIQKQLFDKFKKGNKSNGLGLGLYIVKKVIDLHGGNLFLNTDFGTTFTIEVECYGK